MMKKVLLLMLIPLILAGCGAAARQSEFWEHDSIYKNWNHLKYSLWGYRHPSPEAAEKAKEEAWWGIDIPVAPAKR